MIPSRAGEIHPTREHRDRVTARRQSCAVDSGLDSTGATSTRSRYARSSASSAAICYPETEALREPVTVTRLLIDRAKNDVAPRTNRPYGALSPRSSSARGPCASSEISVAIPLYSTISSRCSSPSVLPGDVR